MTLTLGSLFDGMAGFPLAFARAGVVTRWLVELEEDCRRVSSKHFPEAQAFADVRDVGAHNLEPVDIITFGSPCQDLSVAGKREGLSGERSGLFFEATRIIRELNPAWAIWENVPGALSSAGGRDFGAALDELADAGALDLCWRVLDAQWFGVAQRRRRVFVVVSFRDGASAAEVLFEPSGGSGHPPSRRTTRQDVARSFAFGAHAGSDGEKSHVGHAKGGPTAFGLHEEIVPTLRAGRTQSVAGTPLAFGGNNTSGAIDVACGLNAKGGSGRSDFETETFVAERLPELAHSLRAQAQLAHRDDVDTLVPDTIAFTSKDHGADATADLSPTLRAMMHDQSHSNGGGQVAVAFTTRDVASALTSNYAKQPDNSDTALGPNLAVQAMAVRRLTPMECLRLQGYPDDYLDDLNLSDSAKYRMCGNSVAVPVVAWLAERLVQAEEVTG